MVYVPAKAVIPDKICIVKNYNIKALNEPLCVTFSSKIDNPPGETFMITINEFSGPFKISKIIQHNNSSFYSWLAIENAIPSEFNPILKVELKHWVLNEIIMKGLILKDGEIDSDTKFVAVIYGQYSTMVIKNGPIYKKILGL